MKTKSTAAFFITRIEPVKVKNQLYGKSIEFNQEKKHIKFSSEFHPPTRIQFDQIQNLSITYDKKQTLLWVGICTLFVFIGFFVLLARIRLPPWKIVINLKKQATSIKIRARITDEDAISLADFCTPHFQTLLTTKKGFN